LTLHNHAPRPLRDVRVETVFLSRGTEVGEGSTSLAHVPASARIQVQVIGPVPTGGSPHYTLRLEQADW